MRKCPFLWLYVLATACFSAIAAEELAIRESGFYADGRFFVRFVTEENYYYVLRRGTLVTRLVNPRDLDLSSGSELLLVDEEPDPDLAFYRVEAIFISAPDDVDNDGIDDLYELLHSAILNPLNPLDALLDPDGDGINNLTAYRRLFGYSEAPPSVVSREVSFFNFGAPVHSIEAVSPEVSLYNGSVISQSDLAQVVSREVSLFNFGSPPLGTLSAISREVALYNFGSPPLGTVSAISREISLYQGAVIPDSDQLKSISREWSVFNFGAPVHSLEAISREVSVLNFEESP
ncbi:MAG: hypothetical protein KIT22_03375 [Verrucomicrobiae bacterium]|nr:hypothetical protein [Verrucomicrobiae bacterium]